MVSVVGLAITFSALLIFIGVIMLLKVLFPYREEKEDETEEIVETECAEDEELAAAITAVAFLRGHRSSQLGSALSEGKSAFWSSK
jgi:Na+-transporting methylmalonyl-CoA/oxaloacetate decarboxylase gamma subunit